jgi:hypothetical protein
MGAPRVCSLDGNAGSGRTTFPSVEKMDARSVEALSVVLGRAQTGLPEALEEIEQLRAENAELRRENDVFVGLVVAMRLRLFSLARRLREILH